MSRVLIVRASAGWDWPAYGVLDADAQARAKAASHVGRAMLDEAPARDDTVQATEVSFAEWIEWFEECRLPEGTEERLLAHGVVALAERPETESPIRVECDRAHVSRTGIRWSASERHTDLNYETREIDVSLLGAP